MLPQFKTENWLRCCKITALASILPTAILAGGWFMTKYSNTPGVVGDVPSNIEVLPLQVKAEIDGNTKSLFLFLHPHCSCSRATIRNLEKVLRDSNDSISLTVFATCPSSQEEEWLSSQLIADARQIGGRIVADHGGEIAYRFGVRTSGHALVYDQKQQLVFSGGLTSSRGHEGVCRSTDDLKKKIGRGAHQATQWPVFGCQLQNNERGNG